jgi:hypothetical protein
LVAALLACSPTLAPKSQNDQVLVHVSKVAAGEDCTAGGQRIDVGGDNGWMRSTADDGVLQADEARLTYYACHPSVGAAYPTLVVTSASPGDSCPAGGHRVDLGMDDGDNGGTAADGVLQTGEIDETIDICELGGGVSTTLRRPSSETPAMPER